MYTFTKYKKLFFLAILLSQTPLLPAAAQDAGDGSASTQITLTGKADNVCSLPPPSVAGAAINASYSNNTVTLPQLIDPQTGLVNPSNITLTFPGAFCNFNATVSMSTKNGGMITTGTTVVSDAGTVLQKIPYVANINWGRVTGLSLDTSATGAPGAIASKVAGGANFADLSISIATSRSTVPVVAGTYNDIITIKLSPSL